MASYFVPCATCRRHIRAGDAQCPFCGAAGVTEPVTVSPMRAARHAFLVASTLASALAFEACDKGAATETARKEGAPSATTAASTSTTTDSTDDPVASATADAGAGASATLSGGDAGGSASVLAQKPGPATSQQLSDEKLAQLLLGSAVPGGPGVPTFQPGQTAYGGPPLNPGYPGPGLAGDGGVGKAPVAQVALGAATGTPDANVVVGKQRARIKNCYQKELVTNADAKGVLTLTLSVNDQGKVANASVTGSSVSASLSGCIAAASRAMVFGVTEPATVTFKVTLTSE